MSILLALAGLGWLLGFVFLWHVPVCRLSRVSPHYPRVSVVIPARDEEQNLQTLLPSLTSQDLQPWEIIVVDDRSQDGTAGTARGLGARVIASRDLPAGWLGKSWACQQGADQAGGEVLVFLDADIRLEPGGFRKLMDTFLSEPGVLSLSPFHKVQTWAEQGSAFFTLMQMSGLNAFTLLGARLKPAGLFGPCVVVKKSDYVRAGGHAAVKNKILENYSLAHPLAAAGVYPRLFSGRGAVSVRLYPQGLLELIRGWSKSFAKGAGQTPVVTLLVIILWISGMIITTAFLVRSCTLGNWSPTAAWLVIYGAYALQFHWHLRRLGTFRSYTSLVFPILLIFFLAIFTWSAFLINIKKQIKWKGRVITRGE